MLVYTLAAKGRWLLSAVLVVSLAWAGWSALAAPDELDLRAVGLLSASSQQGRYVLSIQRCDQVRSVSVGAGTPAEQIPATDIRVDRNNACEIEFGASGAAWGQPVVDVYRVGVSEPERYTEVFAVETDAPRLEMSTNGGVRFIDIDGRQHLVVTLTATEETDISVVAASVLGLRASTLEASGGIVEKARPLAFADSDGEIRLTPFNDAQTDFQFVIPTRNQLETDEIANDGLVLVEAWIRDASGNQGSLSELVLTGSGLADEVVGFDLRPEQILFTSPLETYRLLPIVTYRFRGRTELPGEGRGVTYSSSDPSRIRVSDSGLVYPVAETTAGPVTITATFRDGQTSAVMASYDANASLVRLEVEGQTSTTAFVLERLNAAVSLPPVYGILVDSTSVEHRVPLPAEVAMNVTTPVGGALSVDASNRLSAIQPIPASNPQVVQLSLQSQPTVTGSLRVAAVDAPPVVRWALPPSVRVGDKLTIRPALSDDVGIKEVRFFLDGVVIGRSTGAPFELELDMGARLANQTLSVEIEVEDTAGQVVRPAVQQVRVLPRESTTLPTLSVETPTPLQRVVAGAPVRFAATLDVGEEPDRSAIVSVDFRIDDRSIGRSLSARMEQRCVEGGSGNEECTFVEVWELTNLAPQVGTGQSSRTLLAVPCTLERCEPERAIPRVFIVVGNEAPTVAVRRPADGASVTVGQPLAVEVEVADDALWSGTTVQVLVDGDPVETFAFSDPYRPTDNALSFQRATRRFEIDTTGRSPGSTITIEANARDRFERAGTSNRVRVLVEGDRPPVVSITSPTPGSTHVSGMMIPIRVAADDDIGITRVDFFVDGVLVGSDDTAPFALDHPSRDGLLSPQAVVLEATAWDTAGVSTRSAPVTVSVGPDDQRPAVNLVSPAISTLGPQAARAVVEQTRMLLRLRGHDNVGVTRLELLGVCRTGSGFQLVSVADRATCTQPITAPDFVPEQIPGALRAFSAVLPVNIPAQAPSGNLYPVTVRALDDAGNASQIDVIVEVTADQPPEVRRIESTRLAYLPDETVEAHVTAFDDVGVSRMELDLSVTAGPCSGSPGATLATQQLTFDAPAPTTSLSHTFTFITNAQWVLTHSEACATLSPVAVDTRGQRTSAVSQPPPPVLSVDIGRDVRPPVADILEPTPGGRLYVDQAVSFHWQASDQTRVDRLWITVDGTEIGSATPTAANASGTISWTPTTAGSINVELHAEDRHGHQSTAPYVYEVVSPLAPTVAIDSPPVGARLKEGEDFEISALVSDDRQIASVELRQSDLPDPLHVWSASDVSDGRVTRRVRAPHRAEGAESQGYIQVHATDVDGLSTTVSFNPALVDDTSAPAIQLTAPVDDLPNAKR